MNESASKEIAANLQRAESSVEAAQKLAEDEYYDFAASRAYYATFYAATAVLLSEGFEFSRHSGVIASIHQRFVKTGKLDKQFGRNLNWLFELRNIGDYGETRHVPKEDAEKAIEVARSFVQEIKKLLGNI